MDNVTFYYEYQNWVTGFTPSPEFYRDLRNLVDMDERLGDALSEGEITVEVFDRIKGLAK